MPNLAKVTVFKNITTEDFVHAYAGTPFSVPANGSLTLPFELADHLATHLARKIMLQGDTGGHIWDGKDVTGGNGRSLFNAENEKLLKDKILGETITQEQPAAKTEIEILKEQIALLNQKFETQTVTEGYKDKGEVIRELQALGQKPDARQSKATLEAELEKVKTNTETKVA